MPGSRVLHAGAEHGLVPVEHLVEAVRAIHDVHELRWSDGHEVPLCCSGECGDEDVADRPKVTLGGGAPARILVGTRVGERWMVDSLAA